MKKKIRLSYVLSVCFILPLIAFAERDRPEGPFPLDERVRILLKEGHPDGSSVTGTIKAVREDWITIELLEYRSEFIDNRRVSFPERRVGWIRIDSIFLVKLVEPITDNAVEAEVPSTAQEEEDSNQTR